MPLLAIFFAADFLGKLHTWRAQMGSDFYLLAFVGAFGLVILGAFGWALIFKQPSHRLHKRGHKPEAPSKTRHHHRHRRKEHRPVNPTLAETGGLPTPRDPKTPPKSHL